MKVCDLVGPVLNAMVARAFGIPPEDILICSAREDDPHSIWCMVYLPSLQRGVNMGMDTTGLGEGEYGVYKPTQSWSHAGPLIDMADISIDQAGNPGNGDRLKYAYVPEAPLDGSYGEKVLDAISRCFVVYHLGAEIPDEWIPKCEVVKTVQQRAAARRELTSHMRAILDKCSGA